MHRALMFPVIVSGGLLVAACVIAPIGAGGTPTQMTLATSCPPSAPMTQVNVNITRMVINSATSATLTIDRDPADFIKGCAKIVWTFAAPGFAFQNPGISFPPSAAPPPGSYPIPLGSTDVWVFDAPMAGSWKYTINVQSAGISVTKWQCDPRVIASDAVKGGPTVDVQMQSVRPAVSISVPCRPGTA